MNAIVALADLEQQLRCLSVCHYNHVDRLTINGWRVACIRGWGGNRFLIENSAQVNQVQNTLLEVQPGFKAALLSGVEKFQQDVGVFYKDYDHKWDEALNLLYIIVYKTS